MDNIMQFPETFEEFAKSYGFKDSKEIYTNGSELIPVFRVEQWLEHARVERTCHFEPDVIEVLLDEDGNEILDADGNEIETGEPAEDCSAFECSECGYPMLYDPDIGWFDYCEPYKPHFKYCPNCGAKVVE